MEARLQHATSQLHHSKSATLQACSTHRMLNSQLHASEFPDFCFCRIPRLHRIVFGERFVVQRRCAGSKLVRAVMLGRLCLCGASVSNPAECDRIIRQIFLKVRQGSIESNESWSQTQHSAQPSPCVGNSLLILCVHCVCSFDSPQTSARLVEQSQCSTNRWCHKPVVSFWA
jgi:hypothetical protein